MRIAHPIHKPAATMRFRPSALAIGTASAAIMTVGQIEFPCQ